MAAAKTGENAAAAVFGRKKTIEDLMSDAANRWAGKLRTFAVVSHDCCAMPVVEVTEDMVWGLLNDTTRRTILIFTKKENPYWAFDGKADGMDYSNGAEGECKVWMKGGSTRRLFWTTTRTQFWERLGSLKEEDICVLVTNGAAEEAIEEGEQDKLASAEAVDKEE